MEKAGGQGYWWEMGREAHHHVALSSSFGCLCLGDIVVLNVPAYSKRIKKKKEEGWRMNLKQVNFYFSTY